MIIREANKNDLNEILQLYLYLQEESVSADRVGRKIIVGGNLIYYKSKLAG